MKTVSREYEVKRRRQRRLWLGAAISAVSLGSLLVVPVLVRHSRQAAPAVGRRQPAAVGANEGLLRPVYPFSVIRGGAYSSADLDRALASDPVAARHYAGFQLGLVHAVASEFTGPVYLSYRRGNSVYWTRRPVRLKKGETLLTDGSQFARARCGNRISEKPQQPVAEVVIEPPAVTLEYPELIFPLPDPGAPDFRERESSPAPQAESPQAPQTPPSSKRRPGGGWWTPGRTILILGAAAAAAGAGFGILEATSGGPSVTPIR